jgi:hypothetical protein
MQDPGPGAVTEPISMEVLVGERRSAGPAQLAYLEVVANVHVPYGVEQDEDGVWSAHAWLGSSGGANGHGSTPGEAAAELREAVLMVLEEDGVPAELAQSLDLEVG